MAANARSCVGGDAERIDVESDVKVEDNNNDKEEKEDLCCRIDRQETLAADTMYCMRDELVFLSCSPNTKNQSTSWN
ncbi:hypothetical protein OPV22_026689 [Ensete ventricosum]|uniref:Uncharacterized protein n=1 Tax=Ensete ventricosum TaxID=4639 RepID=A0AAV8PTH0_ENSVE|nr:hypothetical protein OPV22_026689 [Ensete ventricosum]